jgi:ERCC4-type nuclease
MIIKIDAREKCLIQTFKEKYADTAISVEQLDIGDIIISNDFCNVLIERKTICDALSSIKDGRWRNQKQRILDNYEKSIYIIENDDIFNNDRRLSSAYVNTLFRDRIPIIFTNSVSDTAKVIKLIYDKMIDEPSRFIGKEKTYVSTLKTKTTKIENIDKKNCFILQLCQIPMINHKIASKIANEFTCMRDFIKNLDSWAENDQISYLCSIENIGSKKAEKIIEYLL